MKVTPELFIDNLLVYLKANLNTNITAQNTYYSDTLLTTLEADAYEVMNYQLIETNYNPFIHIDCEIKDEKSADYDLVTGYSIDIDLVFESSNDLSDMRRVWRYHSALLQTINDSWDQILKAHKPLVKSLNPITIQLVDSQQQRRVIGVNLMVYL